MLPPPLPVPPPAPQLETAAQAMIRLAASLENRMQAESSSDDEEAALVDDMVNLSNNAEAGADGGLFQAPAINSAVMGPSYSTGGATMATFRESQIKEAESSMSSNDKKRLVRLLMETNYFCEDLKYLLRYALPMRSLGELASMINTKGLKTASDLFEASQEKIKGAVDTVSEKLKHELGLVHLANDKSNNHGFAAIDKMKSLSTLEAVTSKEQRDLWNKACSSLDKMRTQRKRKGHGNRDANRKRKRGNAGARPALPTCAACNKAGHVAGDAKCKAAPKP